MGVVPFIKWLAHVYFRTHKNNLRFMKTRFVEARIIRFEAQSKSFKPVVPTRNGTRISYVVYSIDVF